MELQTIRKVLKDYGISRRTLTYYEEIGLIKSSRKNDYAYRVYEESEITRLQQIILLRKLQIPMKQIKDILNNQNAVAVIEIFKQNINELDEKITALSSVKSILIRFVYEMQEKADVHLKLDLLNDKTMLVVINALSFPENKIKEKVSMEELNKANETLEKLEKRKNAEIIGPEQTEVKNIAPTKSKFTCTIEKCEPYRFIGKSVYFRNDWGSPYSIAGDICKNLWKAKDWIFNILDTMTEYHTDMPYAGGVYMWDRYDEKNQQQGYIIGKFLKAETPVPEEMDYFDIPEGYIAKGWGGYVEQEVKTFLNNSAEYANASWNWSSEVFTDSNFINQDDTKGYFICTTLREPNN